MAILIKDQEADQLIRALAERTGESITDAVKEAVRERLKRVPPRDEETISLKRKIAKLIARAKALPTVDDRNPEEIAGYNDLGHFD